MTFVDLNFIIYQLMKWQTEKLFADLNQGLWFVHLF